jgi:arylformamidase
MTHADGIDPLKKIILSYTKLQLDAQYDQSSLVPDMAEYVRRWRAWSSGARTLRSPRTLRYGNHPKEELDFFSGVPGGQIHLHIHGGAWKALTKEDAAFVVRGGKGRLCNIAVLDFALAPEVRLSQMVSQVRRGFLWLRNSAQRLDSAEGPILVSGHSSGAHLAATLIDRNWWREVGLTAADFAGVVLASGCYDLEPVRLSARNDYLKLTKSESYRLSPLHQLPEQLPPVCVVWGEHELAEFRRQSRCFAEAVADRTPDLAVKELPDLNHFEVYDSFHDPASAINKTVSRMIHNSTNSGLTNKEEIT